MNPTQTQKKKLCRKRGHPSGWIRKEKRLRVYQRDRFSCVYCSKTFKTNELTLDHVKPRSNGGTHHHRNLVTACRSCNSSMQALSLAAWCFKKKLDPKPIRQRIRNAVRRKLPKMTVVNKKELIIKDMLMRVKKEQYLPRRGVYVYSDEWEELDLIKGGSIQTFVKEGKPCQVCAVGGALLSYFGIFNNDSPDDFDWISEGDTIMLSEQHDLGFTGEEFGVLESLFEINPDHLFPHLEMEEGKYRFYKKLEDHDITLYELRLYTYDKDRLIIILEGVLEDNCEVDLDKGLDRILALYKEKRFKEQKEDKSERQQA